MSTNEDMIFLPLQVSLLFLPLEYMTELMAESSRPNSRAHQKLLVSNPVSSSSAIRMMMALITKRKSPSVIMVMGRVNRISNGLTMAFSNASTIARMMAVQNELISTPFRI